MFKQFFIEDLIENIFSQIIFDNNHKIFFTITLKFSGKYTLLSVNLTISPSFLNPTLLTEGLRLQTFFIKYFEKQ